MTKKKSWKDKSGLRDEMKIRKLVLETQKHDRATCRCEGCYYWAMGRTVTKGGRFFQVIPTWKDLDRNEYLKIIMSTIKFRMDKESTKKELIKYLLDKGVPKERMEETLKIMLRPITVVMYGDANSPLGILRDI